MRTPYLLNELGFLYSSSMRGDDVPYYTVLDGKETDLVEIPSKWELDDYVAQGLQCVSGRAGRDWIGSAATEMYRTTISGSSVVTMIWDFVSRF